MMPCLAQFLKKQQQNLANPWMDGLALAEMYQGGLYFDLAVDRIKIFLVCRFFKNFAQF